MAPASPGGGWDTTARAAAAATEVDAALVVIGLRRRSPVGTLFRGRAASRILLTVTDRC
jgi:nucleotide-binding universal stress UspA family protein